jgi:hypothetical protein
LYKIIHSSEKETRDMEKFAAIELKLKKSVANKEAPNLITLFSADERFKQMDVLTDAEEGDKIRVVLEGLAETELLLGDDMEKGQKKTLMTLFWFSEKSKPVEMQRTAEKGESITITMWK